VKKRWGERASIPPRYRRMDIGFTIVVLLLVFMIATAIGFAWAMSPYPRNAGIEASDQRKTDFMERLR